MSRASRRTQNSVSLFPFLAVLVCAMGALIFLLLVTTRRIRSQAIEQARQEQVETAERAAASPPTAVPEPVPLPLPTPSPEPEPEPEPPPRPRPVRIVRIPSPDPNDALRQQLAELQAERRAKQDELDRLNRAVATAEAELRDVRRSVATTAAEVDTRRDRLATLVATAERMQKKRAELQQETESLGDRIARARQRVASEESRFAFVPFEGATGTTRRPIFIECTKEGLRFLPENVRLTEADLVGFTLGHNPLLNSVRALSEFWLRKDLREDPGSREPPYALLLVKPDGAAAFYAAQKLLSELDEPFGYELVPEDMPLELPDRDDDAAQLVRETIAGMLALRQQLTARLRRETPGGSSSSVGRFSRPSVLGATNGTADENRLARNGSAPLPVGRAADPSAEGEGRGGRFDQLHDLPGGRRSPVERISNPSVPGNSQGTRPPAGNDPSAKEIAGGPTAGRPFDASAENDPTGFGAGAPGEAPHSDEPGARGSVGRGIASEEAGSGTGSASQPRSQRSSGDAFPADRSIPDRRDESLAKGSRDSNPFAERSRSDAGSTDDAFPEYDPDPFGGPKPTDVFERATRRGRSAGGPGYGTFGRGVGGIGFERGVAVDVRADELEVDERYRLPIENGTSAKELTDQLLEAIDRRIRDWGPPPRGFHWVPTVEFRVRPGGNVTYERLRSRLQSLRLSTRVEYALEADENTAKRR